MKCLLTLAVICFSGLTFAAKKNGAGVNIYYLDDYCFDLDVALPRVVRSTTTAREDYEWEFRNQYSGTEWDQLAEKYRHKWQKYVEKIREKLIRKANKYRQKFDWSKLSENQRRKLNQELKMIELDPFLQPSVVLKTCGYHRNHSDDPRCRAQRPGPQKCFLLLRVSNHAGNDSEIGTTINFAKYDLSDSNDPIPKQSLRIVSSDPNMTRYWLFGNKVANNWNLSPYEFDSAPVISALNKLLLDSVQSSINQTEPPKWIFFEFDKGIFEGDEEDKRVITGQKHQFDQTEMIINLFKRNSKMSKQCPVGTFDCFQDGSQCIDSNLRCNGEDNCGNGFDEQHCRAFKMVYIIAQEYPTESSLWQMFHSIFWYSLEIAFVLLVVALIAYCTVLLFRVCNYLCCGGCFASRKAGKRDKSPKKAHYIPIGDADETNPINQYSKRDYNSMPPPSAPVGSQMDTRGSRIQEHIYVNNNYGQPQGSTVVHTTAGQSLYPDIGGPPPKYHPTGGDLA